MTRSITILLASFALVFLSCCRFAPCAPIARQTGRIESPGGKYVAFSRDSRSVLTADVHAVRVWDVASLKPITPAMHPAHEIQRVLWVADNKTIVTVGERELVFWTARSGKAVSRIVQDVDVGAASVTPDGQYAVTSAGKNGATLWDVSTGKVVYRLRDDGPLCWASFNADGTKLLTFNFDWHRHVQGGGVLHMRDVVSGREIIAPYTSTYEGGGNSPAQLSPDGTLIAVAEAKGFSVFRLNGFAKVSSRSDGRRFSMDSGYTQAVRFVGSGAHLAWIADVGVQIFDSNTGKPVDNMIDAIAYDPLLIDCEQSSRLILLGGLKDQSGFWDARRAVRDQALSDKFVSCVALSPDGKYAATGHPSTHGRTDGYTEIWRIDKLALNTGPS